MQGHNYQRYNSNCGGCCDCGDLESWCFEGWCKKHQQAKYVPDADLLMDPMQLFVTKIIPSQRRNAISVFRFSFLMLTTLFDTVFCPYKDYLVFVNTPFHLV